MFQVCSWGHIFLFFPHVSVGLNQDSKHMGCTFVHLHMQMQVQTQGKQFYMWFNRLFSHDVSEIQWAGGRIVDWCSSPTLHLCLLCQNQDKLSTRCSLCGSVSILSPKFPINFNLHLGLPWPMSTATSLVLSFG